MSNESQHDRRRGRAFSSTAASLGTGSRSPSGTISLNPSQESNEEETVLRPRLYSEEDEDLRKAKAMALAIQQNPNMTADEIHQLHFGDEAQSQILKRQQEAKRQQPKQTAAPELLVGVVVDDDETTNPPKLSQNPNAVKKKVAAAKARATAAKDKAKANLKSVVVKKKTDVPLEATSHPPSSSSNSSMTTKAMENNNKFLDATTTTTTTTLDKDKIRLSATVWKRRSGFGKLSYSKAWERRKVILKGSKLFYFKMADNEEQQQQHDGTNLEEKEASWFDQMAQNLEKVSWLPAENDPSAPRGYFDLYKEGTTVAASSGHSGAPSPFAISIKIKSDTVWKLCFDSHAVQMEWLAALTDAVVTASVDSYNANLLLAADPNREATMFESEYLPPPGSRDAGTQLWMTGSYRVSSLVGDDCVPDKKGVEMETETAASASTSSLLLLDNEEIVDRWILKEQDVRNLLIIVNAALISSRASLSNPQSFWYILTFCNMGLGYYLVRAYKKRSTASAPAVEASIGRAAVAANKEIIIEEDEEVTGFKPKAGSTTVKLEHPEDSPEIDGQIFGAWCAPPGESLAVRSHGYLTTKEKIPSPGELYDCSNVDIFESPHRYPDMSRRVELPSAVFEGEDPETKTWHAPDVFIVSVALPTDPPSMRSSSNDGGGFTITMYFRANARRCTKEQGECRQAV